MMSLISDVNTQELIQKKRNIQAQLASLLDSPYCTKDSINEYTSEIRYIDGQINKKIGAKELRRLEEINNKRSRADEIAIKRFNDLNKKRKRISTMFVATERFLNVIDNLEYTDSNKVVKVKN